MNSFSGEYLFYSVCALRNKRRLRGDNTSGMYMHMQ